MLNEFLEMKQKKTRFALLALSAVLTGLTLVFPVLGFLEWVTLIPACLFLFRFASDETVRLRRLYGYGCFFFYFYSLFVFISDKTFLITGPSIITGFNIPFKSIYTINLTNIFTVLIDYFS